MNNNLDSQKNDITLVRFSVDHPKTILAISIILMIIFAAMIPWVHVDTDPENMLEKDEPVRVFHNEMKKEFSLYDMVVVGIVDEKNPNGVFNPQSLKNAYELTQFAKTLQWPDPENPDKQIGVVEIDILAPSEIDNIEQAGLGSVRFEWLMASPPQTQAEADRIRNNALDNPLLKNTMVSHDGKALCLYLPLTSKDLSYRVYSALNEKIKEFNGTEEYFITGLPVAEDTFGVEMFIQMAISAPLAMLVIFLLMWYFFRKLAFIISPMIVAMLSVIYTMGLLIGTGNTVHIMSSMIPIFVMPIAVLDSIHILSDFFDRYHKTRDRRKTILEVMRHLFVPMLYTSLTSAAGFASLALAHIPPVQVFGLFVAFGIMAAWLLTITLIPAYTMLMSDKALENFGHASTETSQARGLSAWLHRLGNVTFQRAKLILVITLIVLVLSIYGISHIQINDNPIKWYSPSHPIRVADSVLNEHLGGTYMAYLALEPDKEESPQGDALKEAVNTELEQLKMSMAAELPQLGAVIKSTQTLLSSIDANEPDALEMELKKQIESKMDAAETETLDAWDEVLATVEKVFLSRQTFKRPDVLRYMASMQQALIDTGIVGKSNSVTDVVKKIHKELFEGKDEYFRVPDTSPAVAQCLISYQNSHDPDDLWHLVTPDYKKTSIWIQLKSGDNKDMEQVIKAVDQYMIDNPPPVPLQHNWFGLTYINVVWQNKMVSGMLEAFLGSFLIVFLMMTILFSSPLWGILCMIPLTVTIGFIYGMIGFAGKDYDMPVAVLSSLTLGLAVDFAIHFLARARELVKEHGSWPNSIQAIFGEPARAIARNLIVIAVGFLPLLAAPLMPYKTVGIFIATILAVSGIGTLLILPALVTVLQGRLFKEATAKGVSCNCSVCVVSSILAVVILAMNLREFFGLDWNALTWFSVILIPILAMTCGLLSRRHACRISEKSIQE